MRNMKALLGLTFLVGLSGCWDSTGRMNFIRPNSGTSLPTPSELPQVADLVEYLNKNAQAIPGIYCDDVTLTCHPNAGLPVTLGGKLRCQGPRNFRMTGDSLFGQELDLGSNEQEFWYWIKRGDPYQVYCSYQAIQEGSVKQMPFPFQPDWVLEAMGMGRYGPADKYTLTAEKDTWRLVEKTRSPQGQPVKKVIVFNSRKAKGNEPQILAFLLLDDATNKEICSCYITERIVLPKGGEIPRKFELRWPEAKMKLAIKLDSVSSSTPIPQIAFVRRPLSGVQSLNLATLKVDGVQRVNGPQGPGVQR